MYTSLLLSLFIFPFQNYRSSWYAEPPFSQSPHPSLGACSPCGRTSCKYLQKHK